MELSGKIKGGKNFKDLNKRGLDKKISRKASKMIMTILLGIQIVWIVAMAGFVFLVSWEIIPSELFYKAKIIGDKGMVEKMLSIIMIILVAYLIYLFYDRVKRLYHINIPSKLRQNIEYEDFEN